MGQIYENGRAGESLHDRGQNVCTCTVVTPHNTNWSDEIMRGDHLVKTDKLYFTLSSVKAQ